MNISKNPNGVTIAMLRAFVSLSASLSLTKTHEELGATRQTVRRHITDLETILGHKLFEVVDRQYKLTEKGHSLLDGAKSLLLQIDVWSGASGLKKQTLEGLEHKEFTDADGRTFYSQQHPISKLTADGQPLMKKALKAWGAATAQVEHEAMQEIRPYTVLFRKGRSGWVFVDIGTKSAYAKWFGWAWSKSAIGKLIDEDNVGDDYNDFISGAYARIYDEGGVRLDDIYAYLPKEGEDLTPVIFQRLLLGCSFPDGTPGLILLAIGKTEIEIDAIAGKELPVLPSEFLLDDFTDD